MKDAVPYIFWGGIMLVLLMLFLPELWAGEVYMQLYQQKEATANTRLLTRDSRMTKEECIEQKAKVEAPLNAGGGYTIPSGYIVDCIPVEYLDD